MSATGTAPNDGTREQNALRGTRTIDYPAHSKGHRVTRKCVTGVLRSAYQTA
jgi:hypothetical protein